jgi:hypothetical protein
LIGAGMVDGLTVMSGTSRAADEELHFESCTPATAADQSAIREQLERMLGSPLFRNSKRYPGLLRFLVEQTLAGNEALLKERTLGVTVFHRAPDYDTNQDTVVRLTAGEVRKRIAQYYHQPEHAGELQIDLRPGSYVPVFRRGEPANGSVARRVSEAAGGDVGAAAAAVVDEAVQTEQSKSEAERTRGHWRRPMAAWLAVAAIAGCALGGGLFWRHTYTREHSAARQLWAPILNEPGQVEMVMADLSSAVSSTDEHGRSESLAGLLRMGEMVNYRDTLAQSGLVAFLAEHGKPFSLDLSTRVSYTELQRGPSVLVGGLDNLWTMRVTGPLRYHFVRRDPGYVYGIEDRQHPEMGGWNVNMVQSFDRAGEDFAIVARIFDQTTGRPVLVAAGLGANGTNAAAQFLLDPARTEELTAHAPRDWQRMNMEAVIRTQILDNHAGPPRLVTCVFW